MLTNQKILILCILLIFSIVLFSYEKNTVLVLDFDNSSSTADLDYMRQAIPDSLTQTLLNTEKFNVVERSVYENKMVELHISQNNLKKIENIIKLASALKANLAVNGSFINVGNDIKIMAKVININTRLIEGGANAKGKTGRDVFALIDDISIKLKDELIKKYVPSIDQGTKVEVVTNYVTVEKQVNRGEASPNIFGKYIVLTRIEQGEKYKNKSKYKFEKVSELLIDGYYKAMERYRKKIEKVLLSNLTVKVKINNLRNHRIGLHVIIKSIDYGMVILDIKLKEDDNNFLDLMITMGRKIAKEIIGSQKKVEKKFLTMDRKSEAVIQTELKNFKLNLK